MTILHAPSLLALAGIRHAFSGALRSTADHDAFARAAQVGDGPMWRLRQVHGNRVVAAGAGPEPPERPEADAWVSDQPGVAIAVASADCVPILLADPEARIVAAVHAGWRGMAARVLARALEKMLTAGARPGNIRAAIGPAVQASCYAVGDEVRSQFQLAFADGESLFDGNRLDLVRAARNELASFGVTDAFVSVLTRCTHCDSSLASYRREGAARGTNLAVIALAAAAVR